MRDFMKLVRTLHIYVSMFGLLVLLFFSITGFTLNHADWFGADEPRNSPLAGRMDVKLLAEPDKLAVVEALRRDLRLSGSVDSFDIDDDQCQIDFKRPGSHAHVAVDRATGTITGEATSFGAMALLNDLHMGRDSGASWSLLIDASAWLMTFVSLSGMALLLQLPKRRRLGLIAMAVGLAASVVVYVCLVP
jgi:hypothetical protein